MRIKSKKAFVAKTTELVFTTIAYVVLVVICMFFIGITKVNVEAELDTMNAHFTCSNNLMSFLKLHASSDQPIEEFLLTSYISYTQSSRSIDTGPSNTNEANTAIYNMNEFGKESTKLLNGILGAGEWEFSVSDYTKEVLTLGEITVANKAENCYVYLPVPCSKDEGDCLLTVSMAVPIKNDKE